MRLGTTIPAAILVLSASSLSYAQEDLSSSGWVESDLHQNEEHPSGALLDGDDRTHFAQHRLEDSEWRVWLGRAGVVEQITFEQGWPDWSQALEVRLETADGSTTSVQLQPGTRDTQSFTVDLPHPTAFVDVHVLTAAPSTSGEGFGGFAELGVLGVPMGGDTTAPSVSNIDVQTESDSLATVSWTTDRPATSQVRYSTETVSSTLTAADGEMVTEHTIRIDAAAPLRGYLELRSADAAGNRAEIRHPAFVTIDTTYQYGVGGFTFQLGSAWIPAEEVFQNDDLRVDFAQQWIGGEGWTDWFSSDRVRELHDAGYTPEVIHYYFGDPVLSDVQARRDAFLDDIRALATLLQASGVGDKVLVTLEPEYNQGEVATWDGWNDLMIEAMTILRSEAGAKVGLLPGDWDIDHVVPISMGRAAAFADFVAFQEMRGSTQNTPEEAGEVVDRALRFSHYLSRKFLRPVRLGYLMVSDYGGWEARQRQVVVDVCERRPELEQAGLVAVSWMSYVDRPGAGGYFGEAEAHKGLKYSNGDPKPAWHVWKECLANGPTWMQTGEQPPGAIQPAAGDSSGCSCRIEGGSRGAWAVWGVVLVGLWIGWWRQRRRRPCWRSSGPPTTRSIC